MKARSLCIGLLGLVGLGALIGCESTGVGNPRTDPETVSLGIVSDDGDVPVTDAGAPENLPQSALRQATLVLGQIRFLPCDPDDEAVSVEGPFVVDLIHGTTEPSIPSIDAPLAGFCALEAMLAPAVEPAELRGRSLVFDGVRSDGVRFLLFAEARATLRVRARMGAPWGTIDTPRVIWALRPRRWVSDQELLTAMPNTWNGARRIVLIDVDRHPLLFFAIRARLAGLSTLYSDLNQNGVLDAQERETDAVLGDGLSDAD